MSRVRVAVTGTLLSVVLSVAMLTFITGVRGGLSDRLESVLVSAGLGYFRVISEPGFEEHVFTEAPRLLSGLDTVEDVASARDPSLTYAWRMVKKGQVIREVRSIWVLLVTMNFLDVQGLKPEEGRWFTESEMQAGSRVCLVTRRVATEYGLKIGSSFSVPLNESRVGRLEVIGIMPDRAYGELYIPWSLKVNPPEEGVDLGPSLCCLVKPKPGLMEEAMKQCEEVLGRRFPEVSWHISPPKSIAYVRIVRSYLRSFLWVSVIGLGVACLDVGGVIIALGRAQRRETGIRRSVGASRFRVMLELLTKGLAVAIVGSLLGVVLGYFIAPWIARIIEEESVVSLKTMGLNVGIASLACLLTILVPAALAVKADPVEAIEEDVFTRRRFLDVRVGSVIAALGVVVAVVSMVVIQGLGRATEARVDRLADLAGRNGLSIQSYEPFDRAKLGISREYPLVDDYLKVREFEEQLGFRSAYLMTSRVNVASHEKVVGVPVTGAVGDTLRVKALPVGWGEGGIQRGECVLGYKVAVDLFGSPARAVGQTVIVGEEVQVKVSGVLEPVPRGMVSNIVEPDETLFMPYEQAIRAKAFEIAPEGAEIFLRFDSEESLASAKETILSLLPVENGEVAFKVVEPFKVLGEYREFRAKSGRIFSLFSSIALVGSGIGIFNYMMVDVLNRRKEIGVLRAVGVPKPGIAGEVLREGLVISGIGGLAAFVIAVVVLILMGNPLPVPEWLRLFGIALGLSGALGVLSGLGPAVVASNQDPVECLRME